MDRSVLLCVATEFGFEVLRGVHEANLGLQLRVTSFKEQKVVERFSEKIRTYAREHGLPLHSWKEIREGGPDWLRQRQIWALVCVGWRYLISTDMMETVEGRVLVTHPALLPRYRGFAPLPSALINGEPAVGVSVMLAAPEVDAGDIVYQERIAVGPKDTIAGLIRGLAPLVVEGVVQSLGKLIAGELTGTPQEHSKATYSVWRDEEDLRIDWDESAQRIERTIRALGPPYRGARTSLAGETVILHKADVAPDLRFEIRQPGKVWSLSPKSEPLVICGEGMLLIREMTLGGRSLIPLKKLRVRFGR